MDKVSVSKQGTAQATPRDESWGLYATGAGHYQIRHDPLPPDGRVLKDYAVLYITGGKGRYSRSPEHSEAIGPGKVIVLFPNVWHRYAPDPSEGWVEYWVRYNGTHMATLTRNGFFSPAEPVLNVGADAVLLRTFERCVDLVLEHPPAYQREMSWLILRILGRVETLSRQSRDEQQPTSIVDRAIHVLEDQWAQPVDLRNLAESFGISYAHFRRMFKQKTGMPPYQFLLSVKIARGKQLLEDGLSVKEAATQLGFPDQYHFSRLFKAKTGVAPSSWTAP
jgi:AraC-like DNA-binding protein